MNRRIDELTWPEISDHLAAGRRTVVMAFGATEQHGPHMPLATDTLLGDELARRVAERLDALVAPTSAIGCSANHMGFPGTLSLRHDTFACVVADVVGCFARSGFERAVLLPSHGGNFAPLARAVAALPDHPGLRVSALTDIRAMIAIALRGEREEGVPLPEGGLHAGEWETSLLLASHPSAVRMELAEPGFMGDPAEALRGAFEERSVEDVSPNGVIGNPARSDAARGRRYWSFAVDTVLESVGP